MEKLKRTTFEVSREMEFFTEKELQMQIGYGKAWWPVAILKELVDNALDACEMAAIDEVRCEIARRERGRKQFEASMRVG